MMDPRLSYCSVLQFQDWVGCLTVWAVCFRLVKLTGKLGSWVIYYEDLCFFLYLQVAMVCACKYLAVCSSGMYMCMCIRCAYVYVSYVSICMCK